MQKWQEVTEFILLKMKIVDIHLRLAVNYIPLKEVEFKVGRKFLDVMTMSSLLVETIS